MDKFVIKGEKRNRCSVVLALEGGGDNRIHVTARMSDGLKFYICDIRPDGTLKRYSFIPDCFQTNECRQIKTCEED